MRTECHKIRFGSPIDEFYSVYYRENYDRLLALSPGKSQVPERNSGQHRLSFVTGKLNYLFLYVILVISITANYIFVR